jgi:hypothetical protein
VRGADGGPESVGSANGGHGRDFGDRALSVGECYASVKIQY